MGGDPRKFHPDPEMCSMEELANHEAACKAWDRGDRTEPTVVINGVHEGHRFHAAVRPFGIGYTDQEVEEPEEPEPDLPLEAQEDEDLLGVYLSNAGQDSEAAMRILADRHHAALAYEDEPSDNLEEPHAQEVEAPEELAGDH